MAIHPILLSYFSLNHCSAKLIMVLNGKGRGIPKVSRIFPLWTMKYMLLQFIWQLLHDLC